MNEMYFAEYLMENVAIFSPIISVLQILSLVFVILYMNYTAKYKNHDLSVAWYILAVFFPVPVAIAFAIKSRKFRHENTKVCSQCGDKYPDTFTMCSRCLIELPELDDPKRMKKKKLGKIFCGAFWVVTVATIVTFALLFVTIVEQTFSMLEYEDALNPSYRIGQYNENDECLYYDKEGNNYTNPNEVVIYGKDGEVYTPVVESGIFDAIFSGESKYEYISCYTDSEGNEYDSYECYVDEDGYFYFDEECEIVWDDSDYSEEELENIEEHYDSITYRYYKDVYVDDEGNKYYYADNASWNEKGELITAKNDPCFPETEPCG